MEAFQSEGLTPWTALQVQELAAHVDHTLPADLVRFLTEQGSGYVSMRVVPGTSGNGMVGAFCSFQEILDRFGADYEWVPPGYLAFAYGAGGRLCVELGSETTSRIHWADFDLGEELGLEESDTSEAIMELLFDSLEEFMADFGNWPIV